MVNQQVPEVTDSQRWYASLEPTECRGDTGFVGQISHRGVEDFDRFCRNHGMLLGALVVSSAPYPTRQ
jgi:hypothetical protein